MKILLNTCYKNEMLGIYKMTDRSQEALFASDENIMGFNAYSLLKKNEAYIKFAVERPFNALNAALSGQDQVPYKEGGFVLGLMGSVVSGVCTVAVAALTGAKAFSSTAATNSTNIATINETLQQNITQLIQIAFNQTAASWPRFFNESNAVNLTQAELTTITLDAVTNAAQKGIAAALLAVNNTLNNTTATESKSTGALDTSSILSIAIAVVGALGFAATLISTYSVYRRGRETNQKLQYETLKKLFEREKEILEEIQLRVKLITLLLSAEENQKEEITAPQQHSEKLDEHQESAFKILGISHLPAVIKWVKNGGPLVDEDVEKLQIVGKEYELSEGLLLNKKEKNLGKFLEFLDEKDDLNLYKQICSMFDLKNWKELKKKLVTTLEIQLRQAKVEIAETIIQALEVTASFADFISKLSEEMKREGLPKSDLILTTIFEVFIQSSSVEERLSTLNMN